MTLKLDELAARACGWLRESGEVSDIVISSRIRLARNLADFPFIRRCTEQDRAGVEKACHEAIAQVEKWRELIYLTVSQPPLLRPPIRRGGAALLPPMAGAHSACPLPA